MKQKYKRFTKLYCKELAFTHYYPADLKEHIQIIYEARLYRKKFDFSKRNYHYKFNPYLHDTLDVRRGRRILNNPKLFEDHFNFQCETLCKRLKYEAEKTEIKEHSLKDTESILEKIVMNDLIKKQIDNLIGEVKCLPV